MDIRVGASYCESVRQGGWKRKLKHAAKESEVGRNTRRRGAFDLEAKRLCLGQTANVCGCAAALVLPNAKLGRPLLAVAMLDPLEPALVPMLTVLVGAVAVTTTVPPPMFPLLPLALALPLVSSAAVSTTTLGSLGVDRTRNERRRLLQRLKLVARRSRQRTDIECARSIRGAALIRDGRIELRRGHGDAQGEGLDGGGGMVLHAPSRRASFLIWTSGAAYRGVFWFKTRQAQRPSSIPRLRGEPHTLSFQFPSFFSRPPPPPQADAGQLCSTPVKTRARITRSLFPPHTPHTSRWPTTSSYSSQSSATALLPSKRQQQRKEKGAETGRESRAGGWILLAKEVDEATTRPVADGHELVPERLELDKEARADEGRAEERDDRDEEDVEHDDRQPGGDLVVEFGVAERKVGDVFVEDAAHGERHDRRRRLGCKGRLLGRRTRARGSRAVGLAVRLAVLAVAKLRIAVGDLRQRLEARGVATTAAVRGRLFVFARGVTGVGLGHTVHVRESSLGRRLGLELLLADHRLALSAAEDDAVQHRGDGAVPVAPEQTDVGRPQRILKHVGHLDVDEDAERLEQTVAEQRERHEDAQAERVAVAVVGELAHVARQLEGGDKVERSEHGDGLDGDLGHALEVLPARVALVALFLGAFGQIIELLGERPELREEARKRPGAHLVVRADVEDVPDEQARSESQRGPPKVEQHDARASRQQGPCQQRADERYDRKPLARLGLDRHIVVQDVRHHGGTDDEREHTHCDHAGRPQRVRRHIVLHHLEAKVARRIQHRVRCKQLEAELGVRRLAGQSGEKRAYLARN
ncbi:hypothetical protein L1887_46806 [Cichorium endivia]|nr:hypothetical protein L1887_46806 [Cichorium endivia]